MATAGLLLLLLGASLSTLTALPVNNERTCSEWIQPFFEFLTLKEARNMKRSDLSRLFSYMDTNVNGKVSVDEFEPTWQGATQMTQADTREVFARWAILRETFDPRHITRPNQDGIWKTMDPNKDNNDVSKEKFTEAMKKMLPLLPNRGCYDGLLHFFE